MGGPKKKKGSDKAKKKVVNTKFEQEAEQRACVEIADKGRGTQRKDTPRGKRAEEGRVGEC